MAFWDRFRRDRPKILKVDDDLIENERIAKIQDTRRKNRHLREIYDQIEIINAKVELAKAQDLLREYEDEYEEDLPGEDPDDLFSKIAGKILDRMDNKAAPVVPPTPTAPPVQFTDEYLRKIKAAYPADQINRLKALKDQQIGDMIADSYPNMTDPDIERAIAIIKE